MLIITYILLVLATFVLGSSMDWYIYEEKAAYESQIIVPNNEIQPQHTIVDDVNNQYWQFYLYWVINAICLCGYIWFTPEKRAKIEKLGRKISEAIK